MGAQDAAERFEAMLGQLLEAGTSTDLVSEIAGMGPEAGMARAQQLMDEGPPTRTRQRRGAFVTMHEHGHVDVGVFRIPVRSEWRLQGNDEEPDVTMQVRVEGGVPYLHSVHVEARGIESEVSDADLRSLATQSAEDWVKWIVGNLRGIARQTDEGEVVDLVGLPGEYTASRAVTTRARRRRDDAQRRRHLARVAEVYRAGGAKGSDAVSREFDVSLRTAQLWVNQARKIDLLGPALKGRAGEAQ